MNTEDKFYFGKHGQPERFEKEYVLWGLPKGETNRLHEEVLSTKAKTPAQMDEIKRRAAKDGWHSFRVQILDLSKPYTRFSRPGQPERFAANNVDLWNYFANLDFNFVKQGENGVAKYEQMAKKALTVPDFTPPAHRANGPSLHQMAKQALDDIKKHKEAVSRYKSRAPWNQYSRLGQRERFAISSSDLNYAKSQIRSASPERLREIEQELLTLVKSGDNNAKTLLAYLKSEWDERYRGTHSRPGQPERFDASSLNRGNFAEASSSPMLGKLLSEKQMPEGGWRAVETGGGALVISFEDADVAGNFARRVAGSGYSATAPVQSIGRYWNVEVKNGKV